MLACDKILKMKEQTYIEKQLTTDLCKYRNMSFF